MKRQTIDAQRSAIMRAVKSKDTAPELQVRRFVHALGYRYRLHRKDLPGTPDLVFPRAKRVIFIHGCFWHGHSCPRGGRVPKTRVDYWKQKIRRNAERDAVHLNLLQALGWEALVVWECSLKNEPEATEYLIEAFLQK